MKSSIFSAAVFTLALAAPAYAADAPMSDSQNYMSAYNWSGFYAGLNGGYSWGDGEVSAAGVTLSGDYDGWLAGAQIGVNWQSDAWVFGLEADWQFTGNDETISNGVDFVSSELKWLSTVRARAGFAMDRFLPYVTGGVAFGDNEISGNITGVGAFSEDNTHVGWTAGAGVEAALTDNLSAKLEYLHVDLGDETYFGSVNAEADFEIIRLGVNYRLPY